MKDSFETSSGPETGTETVRQAESRERFAERLDRVWKGEEKAKAMRAEGDAELASSRAEAPAVLVMIDPAGPMPPEVGEEGISAAVQAAERALGLASRANLIKIARELADDAREGTDADASMAALKRLANDADTAPEGMNAHAAREWASAGASVTSARAERDRREVESVLELSEADRKADVLLARLRDLNPAAAGQADADFQSYRREAAERPDAMERRSFLAGWYAANAEAVAAGIADPAKREEALASVAGLAATRGEAVDRYLRVVAPGKDRRMAEASLAAQRDLVGAKGEGVAPVQLEDGRTALRGERGWLVVGTDGKTQALDGQGKVLAAFDATRPGITLAGRTGYPIQNFGADAGKVAREGRAVRVWEEALSGRGLGFLTGPQLKRFEDALAATAAHRGGRQVRFTESPTPRALEDALAGMERMLGFVPGELFNPDDGMRLRLNRNERGLPEDMAPYLRNRMAGRGLLMLGGGLAYDQAVAAIGKQAEIAVGRH